MIHNTPRREASMHREPRVTCRDNSTHRGRPCSHDGRCDACGHAAVTHGARASAGLYGCRACPCASFLPPEGLAVRLPGGTVRAR